MSACVWLCAQLFRDKWRGFMGSFSSNYISDDKLGSLLKQWAGDVKEEEQDKKEQVRAEQGLECEEPCCTHVRAAQD